MALMMPEMVGEAKIIETELRAMTDSRRGRMDNALAELAGATARGIPSLACGELEARGFDDRRGARGTPRRETALSLGFRLMADQLRLAALG
jgi:hypothetical protein